MRHKMDAAPSSSSSLYGHPLAGLLWERLFEDTFSARKLGKGRKLRKLVCSSSQIVLVTILFTTSRWWVVREA